MNWKDMPSLTALRAFEAAVRLGSYSAAARELNVTHAAIAQHVRGLEARFATLLMERVGRGMGPTDAGFRLAQAVSAGFQQIAVGVEDLRRRSEARPLRIALTPTFAENWLMPRIGRFWAAHPEIQLELVPSAALVDLRRDGFDLAVRYGRGPWPGYKSTSVLSAAHVIIAAPRLAAEIGTVTPAALSAQPWLMEQGRVEMRLWAESLGIDIHQTDLKEFDNHTLVLKAVIAGFGVSMLPKAIVVPEVEEGRLAILIEEEDSPLSYHIVTIPGQVTPAVETFRRWIRKEAER